MPSQEAIREKIRNLLIEKEGNIQQYDLKDIIIEAKLVGLNDNQIRNLVPEVDRSINWELIKQQKQFIIEEKERVSAELKKKEEEEKRAPEFIASLVNFAFADGIVESKELIAIFEKALLYTQDINVLASSINSRIDAGKFRPFPNPDLSTSSLKDTLCSTSWYSQEKYAELFIKSEEDNQIGISNEQDTLPTGVETNTPKKSKYKILFGVGLLVVIISIIVIIKSYSPGSEENISKAEEAFTNQDFLTAKNISKKLKDISGTIYQSEAENIYSISDMISGPYSRFEYQTKNIKYLSDPQLYSLYDSLVQRVPIQSFLNEKIGDKLVREVLSSKLGFYDDVLDEMMRRGERINGKAINFKIANGITKNEIKSKYCIRKFHESNDIKPSINITKIEAPVVAKTMPLYPNREEYLNHLKGYTYCAVKCLDVDQLSNVIIDKSIRDPALVTVTFNIDGAKCSCVYTLELEGGNYVIKGKCQE